MRSVLFAILIFVSFSPPVAHASQKVQVLSFRVWKQKKIDEAKSVLLGIQKEIHRSKLTGAEEDLAHLKRKALQAEISVSVARSLSANDYIVMYVYPQFKDDKLALTRAAKSLSSKDFAEILEAYEKRLQEPEVMGAQNNPSATESLPL